MADPWQQAVDWARNQNTHWEGIARDLNNRENLGYSESGTVVNLDVLKHSIASAGKLFQLITRLSAHPRNQSSRAKHYRLLRQRSDFAMCAYGSNTREGGAYR
jgi:hypothetical protein